MRRVLGEHRSVTPVDDMAVLREVAVEQYELRWVVADHAVVLVDVMAVLGEVGAVEQFEAPGVSIGKLVAVYEDRRLVPSVSRVQCLEAGGVGVSHLESLAGEGVQVVDLAVFDVVPRAVEERIRRAVPGCTRAAMR
jgi:hypothetical protein